MPAPIFGSKNPVPATVTFKTLAGEEHVLLVKDVGFNVQLAEAGLTNFTRGLKHQMAKATLSGSFGMPSIENRQ